jgi:transposase
MALHKPLIDEVGEFRIDLRRSDTGVQISWRRCAGWITLAMTDRCIVMISPNEVWLVVEPVDMRAGIDDLSLRIQNAMGRSPCDGNAYVFRNRRGTRLKLLIWDGTGVWLCHRRLHEGWFVWPTTVSTTMTLTTERWRWLITEVDWQRLGVPPPVHWRVSK